MKKTRKRYTILRTLAIIAINIVAIYFGLVHCVKVNTKNQTVEVGTTNSYTGIKATLFGIDITSFGKTTGNVNINKLGEYQVEYYPNWIWGKYQKTVKVVDSEAPKILLEGEKEIYLLSIDDFVEPGFTASDNFDGDITKKVTADIIQYRDDYYEVQYHVKDSSNNIAVATRKIFIKDGIVYLTFDDGPSTDITPQILDILKENNITATFFVVGYGENKEELIRREYAEGHTIGIHGFSHTYSEIYTDLDTLMENFYKMEELVSKTTDGYRSKIIRFPGGSSNTVSKHYCTGIMTEAVGRATEEGYVYFDWNVDSSDAGGAKTTEEVYQNVISGIKPGRNNIVLMHDFSGNTKTLQALQIIIDYCKENNYYFKSITNETRPVQHNVSN